MTRAVNRPYKITGRKPKLPPEEVMRVWAWAEYGTSIHQVARRLRVNDKTLRAYINRKHKRPIREAEG